MTADGVLIVGVGNPLRTDDGAGWHAAARLAADARVAGARVLARHQLTPELAEDIHEAALVVLVDARTSTEAPGAVTVHAVEPDAEPAPVLSHHLDPAALAGLAKHLYGAVPPVYLVTAGADSLAAGERLSPTMRRALPALVDAAARLAAEHGHA